MFRSYVSFLAVVLSMPSLALEAPPVTPVETVPITANLAMLTGAGGNLAVLTGRDGPVIVDDQYAPQVPNILAAVKALQDTPIRFVVNTHFHLDHTGGNDALGGAGALIVAHDNVRTRLSTEQFSRIMNQTFPPRDAVAWPVVTFTESVTLHWNDEAIEVDHVANAHTDGDALVWFRAANAVHCGDTFFNGFYPFIDVGSGGSIDGMIAAADAVLARADEATRIIPGHGPLAGKAELTAFRAMLVTVRDRVTAGVAAGRTMEEFIASRPLADLEADWGDGFLKSDQFTTIVWMELSAR